MATLFVNIIVFKLLHIIDIYFFTYNPEVCFESLDVYLAQRRPDFPDRNVVFNKTIPGRRRTLLSRMSVKSEKRVRSFGTVSMRSERLVCTLFVTVLLQLVCTLFVTVLCKVGPAKRSSQNLISKLLGMLTVSSSKAILKAPTPRCKIVQKMRCSRAMLVQPTVCSLVLRVVGYDLKCKLLFDVFELTNNYVWLTRTHRHYCLSDDCSEGITLVST